MVRPIPSAQNLKDGTNSHTIFSDDHGDTWTNGKPVGPSHMGECSVSQGRKHIFLYARVWWDVRLEPVRTHPN